MVLERKSIAVLFAIVCVSSWVWTVAAFTGGFVVWGHRSQYLAHIVIVEALSIIAIVGTSKIKGDWDVSVAEATRNVVVLFGLYAFLLISFRLFFSRPMLIGAATIVWISGIGIVLLRQSRARSRVCVIGPLTPGFAEFGVGEVVSDPEADLQVYDVVLVSLSESVSAKWSRALSKAMLSGARVQHIGKYLENSQGSVSVEHFHIDHVSPNQIASYKSAKRALDIVLAIYFAPFSLFIVGVAVFGVLISMGAPVFFVQERIGLGGRPFKIWKVRTMRPEQSGTDLKAAVVGDARVTPLGRFLRRFRIDELPQLWNVLKGEMSVIGPRPEAVSLHNQYATNIPNYNYRYLVRPGITGWAQVNVPPSANALEAKEKLKYDLYYVKNVSLPLDMRIVWRTIWTVLGGGGVR